MKIHWLQHVPFEGLGCIGPWLVENGHEGSCTRLWAGDRFPDLGNVDGLIVMGGPMGVTDEAIYPWLADEKAFIKAVISQNKPVLGICLGAQLIAEVLGSKVWKNEQKEIGFFPMVGKNVSNPWKLPEQFTAFHWHGDTFGIPDGAVRLASSETTENQAFIYNSNVLALQFHLETTEESLLSLYNNCSEEITDAPFIQTLEKMRPFFPMLGTANALMSDLLYKLFG
ncbi:MAG: type 1 glutamine amidotransferase [Kiritimatiellales bacterium]